jgi:hypothetical protein
LADDHCGAGFFGVMADPEDMSSELEDVLELGFVGESPCVAGTFCQNGVKMLCQVGRQRLGLVGTRQAP